MNTTVSNYKAIINITIEKIYRQYIIDTVEN